jgi:hypothetical protein
MRPALVRIRVPAPHGAWKRPNQPIRINDVLRRDGILPAPYIIPVSTALQKPVFYPSLYDAALQVIPTVRLMQRLRVSGFPAPNSAPRMASPYNLHFEQYADALHAWKHIDLTQHVIFIAMRFGKQSNMKCVRKRRCCKMLYRALSRPEGDHRGTRRCGGSDYLLI